MNKLPEKLKAFAEHYTVENGKVYGYNFDRSAKHEVAAKGWLYDWKVNDRAVNGFFNSGTGAGNTNVNYWHDIKAKIADGMPMEAVLGLDELIKRGITSFGWPTAENIWNYPELWGMYGYRPPEGYVPNCGMVAAGIFTAEELAADEDSLTWENLGKNWYEVTGSIDPLSDNWQAEALMQNLLQQGGGAPQRLVLPINDMRLTASYKNAAYRQRFGFDHYGVDATSRSGNTALYGLGSGIVVAAGLDGAKGEASGCGYVLVIKYPACVINGRDAADLVCTYFHMREKPPVKTGDEVTTETLLGHYGNTGANTTGAHLHIQFDTDTDYPLWCSGISGKESLILKPGTVDSTVDPLDVLHIGPGQSLMSDVDPKYYAGENLDLPTAGDEGWEAKYKGLVAKLKALLEEVDG